MATSLDEGLRSNPEAWTRESWRQHQETRDNWRQHQQDAKDNWRHHGAEPSWRHGVQGDGRYVSADTRDGWRQPGVEDGGWRGGESWQHPQASSAQPHGFNNNNIHPGSTSLHPGGGGWYKFEDPVRLSQDLLRLKDRYMRDDGRDTASGMSRESSRDDINSVCDQQFEYEERFRVDRRKLELMMLGSGDSEFGEAAAIFFEGIGNETDTVVIWPSRLKIGAKSRKDPHIRVGGKEEGVKIAKARITEVLDSRVNSRVTMKMDVSYTDHSHIIGKGGNTIRRVMADTNCHIHFPDSNRSNPNEKSNQVSIAGEMEGVERARARVRELTPLIFQFDLAIVSFHSAPDPNSTYLRAIQDQYNVQVSFRQKQKNFHTNTVVVKGCELEASRVKEATLLLMDHLCMGNAASASVNMTMEISPGHHPVVVGKGSINLRVIMQRTNTIIIFPDAGDPNIPPIRKGSVTISGAIHNVYLARQLLLGSLPIVMMFDLPENIMFQETMIQKLQDESEVTLTIRPKARQTNKSVIIKSQERNVAGMYAARHKLLDLEGDIIKAEVPETYKVPLVGSSSTFHLASLPANRGPFLCAPSQLPALGSPLSPNLLPPSCYTPVTPTFPPGSPWHVTQPAALPLGAPEMGKLTPTFPPAAYQDIMMMMGLKQQQEKQQQQQQQQQLQAQHQQQQQQHQQHLQQQQQLHQQQLEMEKKHRMTWTSPQQQNISKIGPSGSDLGSSMHSSPVNSPRNSSPVHSNGNLTNNLHKMELTNASSGIDTNHNVSDISAIMADFPELNVTDRRAPGCEKKVAEIVDYEQARLRANQAIQQKPRGEERKPNSGWAGYGFSSSMPESVIREKLQSEGNQKRSEHSNSEWMGNMEKILENDKDELGNLLVSQGLGKYAEVFQRHEIDLATFSALTENELKEIGINTFGPRKKLLMLSEKIRNLQ